MRPQKIQNLSASIINWGRLIVQEDNTAQKLKFSIKVQPCKSYDNKYMFASTQITITEMFAIIAVLVFKLLSRKVLFASRKSNRNC